MYYFLTKGMTQQVMDAIKAQFQREEERRDVMMKQMKEKDKSLGESDSTDQTKLIMLLVCVCVCLCVCVCVCVCVRNVIKIFRVHMES